MQTSTTEPSTEQQAQQIGHLNLKAGLAALGFFLVATTIVMRDLLLSMDERALVNAGDMRLNFLHLQWGLDWLFGNVPKSTQGFFDFNCFHPYRESLALSHNHSGSLPLTLLLNGLSSDWFTRGNIWLHTCLVLNAWTAFHAGWLWQKDLTPRRLVSSDILERWTLALLLGMSFGFSITRLHYLAHPQTVAHFATPYFFLYGFRALKHKSWQAAFLAGLFFGWQTLLDIHLAIIAYVVALPTLMIYMLRQLSSPSRWIIIKKDALLSIIFIIPFLALSGPILYPYLATVERFGKRPLLEIFRYAPEWSDFFRTSKRLRIYDSLMDIADPEKVILPSLIFLFGLAALLTWAVLSLLRKLANNNRRLAAALGIIATTLPIVFALDFVVHRSVLQTTLHDILPGVESIRTPGRASIYLAPILVCTWIWVLNRAHRLQATNNQPRHRRWVRFLALAACAWILLEGASQKFATWQPRQNPDLEAVFQTLSGPTIILPDNFNPYILLDYMQVARTYRIRLGNGYSGWIPKSFIHLRKIQKKVDPAALLKTLLTTYYEHVVVDLKKFPIPEALLYRARVIGPYAIFDRGELPLAKTVADWRQIDRYFENIPPP